MQSHTQLHIHTLTDKQYTCHTQRLSSTPPSKSYMSLPLFFVFLLSNLPPILPSIAWLQLWGIFPPPQMDTTTAQKACRGRKKEKAASDWHVVCATLSSSFFVRLLKCRLQNRHKHVRVGVQLNHSHMAHC